jgi:hypothetical protein
VERVPFAAKTFGKGEISVLTLLAVMIALVGVWSGIVPYVGGLFGFGLGDAPAWHWTVQRALLDLVPGGAALLAALLLLGMLPALAMGTGRLVAVLALVLVMLAGSWLVLGPSAYLAIAPGSGVPAPHGSPGWVFIQLVGYHYGPGLVLVAFGAGALGLLPRGGITRRRVVAWSE